MPSLTREARKTHPRTPEAEAVKGAVGNVQVDELNYSAGKGLEHKCDVNVVNMTGSRAVLLNLPSTAALLYRSACCGEPQP